MAIPGSLKTSKSVLQWPRIMVTRLFIDVLVEGEGLTDSLGTNLELGELLHELSALLHHEMAV